MDYSGVDGFLGNRASLMLDVVFLAMFVVVPVMIWSIVVVARKRNFQLHKRIQVTLAIVLAAAVALFETDMRLYGWRDRAKESPYFSESWTVGAMNWSLWVHLAIAIVTTLLWIAVIVRAVRNFPSPPAPGPHSVDHKRWARLGALGMVLTSITGWVFYYLAFVAT